MMAQQQNKWNALPTEEKAKYDQSTQQQMGQNQLMNRGGQQQGQQQNLPMPPTDGAQQPPWQAQGPYPQPQPPTTPVGPNSPFNPMPPTPPATPSPGLPYAPGQGGAGQDPNAAGSGGTGSFAPWNPNEKNQYGGQQIAGADPSQADYQSVQQYADDAHANARRYLDPQQDQQNRRFDQELVNKGIDPTSPQGKEMASMLAMQQADANNAAAFSSLGFGQGIQNQMSQQELANQQLAGNMQQSLWNNQLGSSGQGLQWELGKMQNQLGHAGLENQFNLGKMGIENQRYGQDLNYMLGMGGQDLQRYGMDLQNQLGQGQLDLSRQGQDFNQMMGLEGINFRDKQFNTGEQRYQDSLLMSLLGMNAPGQGYQYDPSGAFGSTINSAAGDKGLLGSLFG